MRVLPKPFIETIDSLIMLPGVGRRTAERYAYALYKANTEKTNDLVENIKKLHSNVKLCKVTHALIDANIDVSPLYTGAERDKTIVAIVAEPFDIIALEKTNQYHGTYHVLGGLLSPIDGVEASDLNLNDLVDRVKKDKVREVILGTNASVEGESTALYVQKLLSKCRVRITRLARGLPIGVDLEYADQITLSRALEGRQEFK